ncbi:Protein of unknown function [Nitrosomonas aestuarii]|uniref:DUF3644 domain-containing protein n=1 Tax=Nitrosomonas aestuarii TaxID=52441 RepID=A0A1I4GI19_9PROT|nr:DUF3644 domain-containing protein [Nitrosomonas aestuarii]SFL28831.1 Protein of unknown function [Nitrosomonas aestuarii]
MMKQKLPRKIGVRELVIKAIESATLAVEVYNKPTVEFRSGAYCTLMVIAWTAIFHAIFERDEIRFYYKEKNGRFKRKEGDRIAWELSTCIKEYKKGKLDDGVIKNLGLFVKLRNKIEHRNMRSVDAHLMPEAQALLLNFKQFLFKEFQIDFLADMGLYIPISILSSKRNIPQSSDERSVLEFIDKYRESLDVALWNDTKYSFRAYLVPKIGNHENSSDVTIEFIKATDIDDKSKRHLRKITALIKSKQTPFDASLMKPKAIVDEVKKHFPDFTLNKFANAWKKLEIRPETNSDNPGETNEKYCYYDPVDKDYRYEPEFIDLIVSYLRQGECFTSSAHLKS